MSSAVINEEVDIFACRAAKGDRRFDVAVIKKKVRSRWL
jgi:hypothetical protein